MNLGPLIRRTNVVPASSPGDLDPVVGWRAWCVIREPCGRIALRSIIRDYLWEGPAVWGLPPVGRSGFHFYRRPARAVRIAELMGLDRDRTFVVGRCALFGWVGEFRDGFRSQGAVLRTLCLSAALSYAEHEELGRAYQCDVEPLVLHPQAPRAPYDPHNPSPLMLANRWLHQLRGLPLDADPASG